MTSAERWLEVRLIGGVKEIVAMRIRTDAQPELHGLGGRMKFSAIELYLQDGDSRDALTVATAKGSEISWTDPLINAALSGNQTLLVTMPPSSEFQLLVRAWFPLSPDDEGHEYTRTSHGPFSVAIDDLSNHHAIRLRPTASAAP